MAKQLNVNLAFTADTGKAKAQIQELQNLLSQITYSGATSGIGDKISVDLQKASTAAKELQFHLNNAFNTTTGKFDLSLLDRSLKTSGANITQLSTQLLGAGATGQQAFLKLAQSISLADQPMLRVSNRMREFGTVMKNTIKWQLSSSMIHGFMGAINSAYGYAQDLNKSLTDIRIVTGNSADEMARFAEQANKTAKALSTTTNDYAKASLIYFQQGLDDAEVQERTDVTIKMANATGTSAQVVSDQMTAVWNNFDDGSKSLEYYADVMAALGAATASSTDEISQGLQKFAAVSETVGLSYEYATAALTAIMSNTRESADVVGTALKTLFARIQGLQLGETLEDGTDLNKYSKALESVGISIYESNGELKAMDNILNEMAAKWDTLNNAQQTALAQTVAGVRQYTQLVALMENWDNGDADSFQANLKTISGAEGTLSKQADIYAQSWEAAEKRVRASAEGIYQSLLDDKFFISLNNGFANVLTGIDSFIDGLGGVKPLITGIASIFISNFAHKIPQVLDNLKYNLQILTKSTKDVYDKMSSDIYKVSNTLFQTYKDTNGKKGINEDSSLGVALKQANDLTAARTKLALVTDKMSESERQMANTSLSIIQQTQDEVLALTKKKEVLEKNIELQMKSAQSSAGYFNSYDLGETQAHKLENKVDTDVLGLQNFDGMSNLGGSIAANLSQNLFQVIDEANNKARSVGTTWEQVANTTNEKITSIKTALGTEFEAAVENIKTKLSSVNQEDFGNVKKQLLNFLQVLPSGVRDIDAVQKALHNLRNSKGPAELMKNFEALDGVLKGIKPNLIHSEKILSSIHGDKIHTLVGNMQDYNSTINEANSKTNILKTMLNEFQPIHVVRMSEAFSALGGMMGNVVTIGRSIKSAFDALSNPDLSGWEKFSTVLMSISMIIPGITSLMRGYATVTSFVNTTTNAYIATKAKELAIKTANVAMDGVAAIAQQKNLQVLRQKNAGIWAEIIAKKANIDITTASTIVETALGGAKKISTAEAIKKITALLAENGVEVAGNAIKTKSIVLQTILNALTGQYAGLLMLLGGGLIIGALIGVVKIFDALHTSQKEANEAIAEANEKYTEEKQKLDELNNSLKTTQDRIAELQSQESISLVEQEELNKLLETEASLQRQVALQEQLTQIAKQNSASTFEDNAKKASSWMDTAPTSEQWATVYDPAQEMYVDKYYDSIEDFKADIDRMYLDANGQVIEGQEALYQQYMDQYDTWVNEYNQAQAQWIEANKDSLLELTEGYQNWFDLYGNNPQYADQMEQYAKLISDVNKAIYGDQYNDKVLGSMDKTFEASKDQKDKDVVNNIVKDLEDGIVDADPASIAAGFSDTFKQSLLRQGILPDDYAQHLIDEYTRAASALKGEVSLEDLMSSEDFNLEDLEILAHLQLTGEETLEEILAKIDAHKNNTIEVGFNLDTWKKDYAAKMDIVNNLETGDSISPEDYALLGEEYQQYFSEQLDGTYKLIIAANTLRDIVNGIELKELKNNIEKNENVINDTTNAIYEKTGYNTWKTAEGINNTVNAWDKVTNEDRAKNIVEGEFASTMAEKLDVNLSEYDSYIDKLSAIKEAWNETYNSAIEGKKAMALTAKNMAELDSMELDKDSEAYREGLKNLASQYEDCQDELNNYLNTLEKYGKESKEARVASEKLAKSIRKAEWDKFTDDALEAAKALKKATSPKDIEKNLKIIQKAFKDSLGFDASIELLEKYKDKFIEWANAGEEASDDIATQLYSLLQLEENVSNNFAELSNKEITLEVGADTYAAESSFSNLADFYSSVKNIVESNPPIVDAYGNADFSNMIAAMLEAGYTAADVAAALQSIGQTEVDFSAWGSTLPNVDFSDINSIIAFINALNAWKGDIEGATNAPITAEAIKKTFGGSLPAATGSGGGRHTGGKPSGGGGGGSKQEPKHAEKKSSSEKERYHTLQNQLEDLTAEYDALADASDRAFGQDKLDAIDAEIKKTDELIDKQEEYLQAIQSDLPVDKSIMTAYYNDTIGGPAMQFDENGNISNYDQIQDAMFNKYNAMTAYDEDSLEWQTFEKKYEQLEKYIEQYEETYDLLREEEANYQDLLNQRIDLELEKVEYKVEIQLEVPENQKEVIEYQLGRIEDDAKKTGEALALLTEQAEMTYDQILINKQGLNDALELSLSAAEITEIMAGNMDVLNGKTFTEDQISAIQDYKDNLLELNEEFDNIRESIEETVLEAFDMWHEKLEEGIEKFDYFGTILESYQSIIDTVGKDTLGISDSLINTLSQASVDNAINEVEATRDAYKALQQAQIDAERELEKAKARGDEQSISFWESTLNEIQQNAEDAHEEMLDSWEEALSKIVEQFEASIQTAVDVFNEAVYQLGGIEALSEEFDRQKEMADMYLDDYQKIYELSKLNRDVNNSIDDTDSLAGKQKLKKLLGEINKLQADGVKMSEYDLEYLQAEYDLRLAEIALEEAQRAKDVVRLSRDNEGNWSYVYTQNTEAVDEAQQKYEDALYAMQDLSSNYIDEISAQLIETSQEMQEALAAIRIEDYASIEEYYEEVERVQEQYQEQLALQEEELNKAVANNKELYDTDWTNYHNAVGYKISDTEEFATKFSDTLLGTLMNSKSDTSNFTNILADATSTLMNELYGAAEQYYTNMAAAMEAAGTTTGTFADDLATNVDQIKQDSEEAATAVEDMATHMQEQMDNVINKVGEWQRTYGEAMNEIINANLAVIDSFNEMLATLSMDDSTVTVKYDIQNHNSDVLDAERFATGGYTGSWGNTGRLGILDEKELILNKDDTENFIEALKISRSMLNTIELNARQASLGLGTLIPTTVKDDIKETLEQVVQITAEFPNATNHNEIEEAFNMLINRASQFANRK